MSATHDGAAATPTGVTGGEEGPPAGRASARDGRRRTRRRGEVPRTGIWKLAFRDLQWRRRRFSIAIAGTGLVFAMTLLISGIAASFRAEASRVVHALGADAWVVRAGITGPFSALSTLPAEEAQTVRELPGIQAATPLIVMRGTIRSPKLLDVNMFGYQIDGLGRPRATEGRLPAATGEAIADEKAKLRVGQMMDIAGRRLRVVGLTRGMTFNAGVPVVYVPIADAQAMAFEGRPLASAVLVRGAPRALPAGLQVMSNESVRRDLFRPLEKAVTTIDMMQILLWIVAVNIIGAVVYLTAIERVRDFAVLKATGYSSRSLLAGLCVQAVVISISAVAIALVLARALAPLFPLSVELQTSAMLLLPVVGVAVGLIASLFGVRRAGSVDPALAFGGP